MNRIREAISDLYKMDMEAGKTGWLQEIHPVSKRFCSFCLRFPGENMICLGF